MFSHIFISVKDFEEALAFYQPLMSALNFEVRFCDPEKPWAAWQTEDGKRPLFIIGHPFDGQPHSAGNGQLFAFQANSRAVVDQCYHSALKSGGSCEGPPGLRPHYHEQYYGAYFRDLDGNKLCVVCHTG